MNANANIIVDALRGAFGEVTRYNLSSAPRHCTTCGTEILSESMLVLGLYQGSLTLEDASSVAQLFGQCSAVCARVGERATTYELFQCLLEHGAKP